jgi:hypothetical protein
VPGESKYGLGLMDIYHSSHKHIDNISGAIKMKGRHFGARMKNGGRSHLKHMTGKGYHSTRIVLDSISVLNNADKAQKRGWTNWNIQCERARQDLQSLRQAPESINQRKSAYDPFSVALLPKVEGNDAKSHVCAT